MEAELDMYASARAQELASISHLRRTLIVIDVELAWPMGLHDRPWLDAIYIEEALRRSKKGLNEWPHTPKAEEALAECKSRLHRLEEKGRKP
jgi:hypothetical protein